MAIITRIGILNPCIPSSSYTGNVHVFSAHADANGLVNFVESMNTYLTRIYSVHGESEALKSLYRRLPRVRKWIPNPMEERDVKGVKRVEVAKM